MNIEQQKQIAAELLERLSLVDPHCILAGGAPRDWYLNAPANDLDIYFVSSAVTTGSVRKQIEKVIGDDGEIRKDIQHHTSPLYKTMSRLKRIFYVNYKGIDVQFMELNERGDTYKIVRDMSVSICKAWWKSDKVYGYDQEFKMTIMTGVMTLGKDYKWSDPHPQKMLERFKGKFHAGTKDSQLNVLVREQSKRFDAVLEEI